MEDSALSLDKIHLFFVLITLLHIRQVFWIIIFITIPIIPPEEIGIMMASVCGVQDSLFALVHMTTQEILVLATSIINLGIPRLLNT